MSTINSILLVGSGRLATHLKHWHHKNNTAISLKTWNRSESPERLDAYLKEKPPVWLAISDSNIVSFYEKYLLPEKIKTVHFSGALADTRLQCAHPLMSFTSELFNNETYDKIHFAVSGAETLQQVLPGFKNNFTQVAYEEKPFYHALCVLAGNFPQLLWSEVLKKFERLNIPDSAVETYIEQVSKNFINMKEKSITGPLVRRDFSTIEQNLSSLKEEDKLKHIYETFVKEFSR